MSTRNPQRSRGKAGKTKWTGYSKSTRTRIAKEATDYGLTRRQARERVNRGTWTPLARNPEKRAPQNPGKLKGRGAPPIESIDDLREAALNNWKSAGETWEDSDTKAWMELSIPAVTDSIYKHASVTALRMMAGATPDELQDLAKAQSLKDARKLHKSLTSADLGWFNNDDKWFSVFWYHTR